MKRIVKQKHFNISDLYPPVILSKPDRSRKAGREDAVEEPVLSAAKEPRKSFLCHAASGSSHEMPVNCSALFAFSAINFKYFCIVLLFLCSALPHCAAEVVDRMVAVVNKQVILQSQLEQAAHVEFLLQGKPLEKLTAAEAQAVLDQLIDRALLEQQIVSNGMLDPSLDEVAGRLREVRAQIPGADSDDRWKAMLITYGVSQTDVEAQIIAQLRVLRFIDLRFRVLAHADRTAVAAYYQEKFLPELRKQGAPEPPLNEVSGKIEKILVEQRINDLLTGWLQALRSQAHIQKITSGSNLAAGAIP